MVVTKPRGTLQLISKRFQPADILAWHRHEGSYGCLMLSGHIRERRRGTEVDLGPGDCTWRPPKDRHSIHCGSSAHVLSFEIPEGSIADLDEGNVHTNRYRQRRSGIIIALGHVLQTELRREEKGSALTLESLLLDLLAEATESSDEPRRPVEPKWLDRVRERLHDELDRKLSLSELAVEAGVHPIHLARTFRRRFGHPLGLYHRRLRLDLALRELVETDKSLTEIALAAGFYDQSHFSNLVKRAVGAPPALLRNLSRS